MDPKAFQIAMEQMQRMTPEQLAQMQRQAQGLSPEMRQQAMQQMQNMSSDDWNRLQTAANTFSPEQMTSQTSNAAAQFQAQQKYMQQGAVTLKEEGNTYHKLGQFEKAIDSYEKALVRLENCGSSTEVGDLQKACRLNLASCYLKLEKNQECVRMCDAILQVDRENMKALYRRGQALGSMGRYSAAATDLKHAKRLVGNDAQQLSLIQEKLDSFASRIQEDFVVEEIDETPPPHSHHSSTQNQPIIQEAKHSNENLNQQQFPTNQDDFLKAAMKMQDDPKSFEMFQQMLANQSDEEIAEQLKAYGMSNTTPDAVNQIKSQAEKYTPEMFQDAVKKMQSLPPDQLQNMMDKLKGSSSQFPSQDGDGGLNQMMDMFSKDPDLMRKMTETVSKLPPEQLNKMAAAAGTTSAPAASSSTQSNPLAADPQLFQAAQKMMANMSPQDMQKMTQFANLKGGQSDPMSMMKEPGMMDSAMKMMQNMNENDLVNIFKQMSPDMSDEMARTSAKQIKHLSPMQMKALMFMQTTFQKVNSAKQALLSRTGVILTLLVLICAVLLRYYGIL